MGSCNEHSQVDDNDGVPSVPLYCRRKKADIHVYQIKRISLKDKLEGSIGEFRF